MSITQNQRGAAQNGFVDALNVAVRENPVAAGLIGMGALWMFFGGAKVPAFGGKLTSAARSVAGAVADAGGSAADGLASAGTHITDVARRLGDSVSSSLQSVGNHTSDVATNHDEVATDGTASSAGQAAAAIRRATHASVNSGMEIGTSLQRNLSATLDRQPLVLGAIGLAIGAGIASAFPSTKIEADFMGEAGAAAKQKIHEFATEATEITTTRAKMVLDDVKREATAHGLTPSAAADTLKTVGEKVRSVAGSAGQSVKNNLS